MGAVEESPLPSPAKAARYDALDALRGLCALCVCLFHFRVTGPVSELGFVRGSWLFVDFFFVLSGFVIAANYRSRLVEGMPIGDFTLLRLGRVYPLHVVMMAAFVAIECVGLMAASTGMIQRQAFDGSHSVLAILTSLTFTQIFGLHQGLTWNHPSWSVAAEFWTYLLFAFAVRLAGARLDRWLAVAVLLAPAALFAVAGTINVTHDWGLLRCVYGFAVGALLCRWIQPPQPETGTAAGFASLVELAAAAGVIAFVTLARATVANLAAPLVFAGAVLVFARQGGLVSRLLVTTPFLRLGQLSYSIYMVHVFVQSRFDDVLLIVGRAINIPLTRAVETNGVVITFVGATPLQGTLLTLVMVVLVFFTAALTWQFVERPGQEWARRAIARRSSATRSLQLS